MNIEEILSNPDRELAYMNLIKVFLEGSENQRNFIRKNWDFGVTWIYPEIERLGCRIHERFSPYDKIISVLVYIDLMDKNTDFKDFFVLLATVYHSCLIANISLKRILVNAQNAISKKLFENINFFLGRSKADMSLDQFWLKKHLNTDGEYEIIFAYEENIKKL